MTQVNTGMTPKYRIRTSLPPAVMGRQREATEQGALKALGSNVPSLSTLPYRRLQGGMKASGLLFAELPSLRGPGTEALAKVSSRLFFFVDGQGPRGPGQG